MRLLQFQSPSAPGFAIKYKADRPFGFVIDDGSPLAKKRLYYFDACEEEALKLWGEAVEATAGNLSKLAPTWDTEEQDDAVVSDCECSKSAVLNVHDLDETCPDILAMLAVRNALRAALPKAEAGPTTKCYTWVEIWQELCSDVALPSDDAAAICAFCQWRATASPRSWFFWTRADLSHLTLAIRGGLADQFRGNLWYICCDAAAKRKAQYITYPELVAAGNNLGDIEALRIIEADLPRTGLPGINQQELRNMLVAFAAANLEIGYCQSMNFIAATLSLFLEEERSFWTLRCLIEDLLPPNYFTSGMAGLRTDLKVLSSLIEQYLPQLHTHLQDQELDLSAITMNWFLCLFLNTLPMKAALRVLDCVMHEGSQILFRVALSILQTKEAELLQAEFLPDAYMLLRAPVEESSQDEELASASGTASDLFKRMFDSWLDNVTTEELARLRATHLETVKAEDAIVAARKQARAKARNAKDSTEEAAVAEIMEPAASLRRCSKELQGMVPEAEDSSLALSSLWASVVPSWLSAPSEEETNENKDDAFLLEGTPHGDDLTSHSATLVY
jgi:hypothetical protein